MSAWEEQAAATVYDLAKKLSLAIHSAVAGGLSVEQTGENFHGGPLYHVAKVKEFYDES